MKLLNVIIGGSFLFLCGCSTIQFVVGVDSIVDPMVNSKVLYYLYPADTTISVNDLYFKEYCLYLRTILDSRGYKHSSLDSAEIIIFVRYGIGNPSLHSYTYSVPIIGRTDAGDATVTTSSSSYGTVGNTFVSGNTTSTSEVKSKPQYDVVGTNTYSGTYTTYFRFLILEALDLAEFRTSHSINFSWRTTITSEGSSDDLRYVMPVMIVASENYIGHNTGKKVEVEIQDDDPKLLRLRNSIYQK